MIVFIVHSSRLAYLVHWLELSVSETSFVACYRLAYTYQLFASGMHSWELHCVHATFDSEYVSLRRVVWQEDT